MLKCPVRLLYVVWFPTLRQVGAALREIEPEIGEIGEIEADRPAIVDEGSCADGARHATCAQGAGQGQQAPKDTPVGASMGKYSGAPS